MYCGFYPGDAIKVNTDIWYSFYALHYIRNQNTLILSDDEGDSKGYCCRNTVFHLARPLVGVVSFFIVPPNTHHPRHFRRGQVFFAIATTAASHTGQYRKRESTLDFYQSSKHIIGPLPETTNRNQTKRSRVPVRGTLNDSPRRYSATKMVQKKENIGRRRRPRRPAL